MNIGESTHDQRHVHDCLFVAVAILQFPVQASSSSCESRVKEVVRTCWRIEHLLVRERSVRCVIVRQVVEGVRQVAMWAGRCYTKLIIRQGKALSDSLASCRNPLQVLFQ